MLDRTRWGVSLRAARTVWYDYGHVRSAREGRCVDRDGKAIPWYTYPAIEFLKQLDFTGKDVFEFGSGQSTLFWSDRARSVVSVEDDEEWFAIMSARRPANCQLILETDLALYPGHLDRYPGGFDVIVVDGAARGKTRMKCCRAALTRLRPGGLIVLDNSDWLPTSSALLRDSGLLEVDMTGLVPLTGHTQTTSLFFDRAFSLAPAGDRQPMPGPGAVPKNWEKTTPIEPPIVEFGGETFGPVVEDVEFEKTTPDGRRRFRMIRCRATAERGPSAAILDVDANRVLLSVNEALNPGVGDATATAPELLASPSLTWEEFQRFIRQHPKRRYFL